MVLFKLNTAKNDQWKASTVAEFLQIWAAKSKNSRSKSAGARINVSKRRNIKKFMTKDSTPELGQKYLNLLKYAKKISDKLPDHIKDT